MTYLTWFHEHNTKHQVVMHKLHKLGYTKEQVIEYFNYENMKEKQPNFCLLYTENKKCHDMPNLNCFLCGCPHFRSSDDGLYHNESITFMSTCSIKSQYMGFFISEEAKEAHLDCSACKLPHTKGFISKNYDVLWNKIMERVLV